MGLRLTPQFSEKDIRKFIESKIKIIEDVVFDQLVDAGEQFVADARSVDTYTDRTSNLRGSIGYVIYKDGIEVFGNFEGTIEGQETSKRFIQKIVGENNKGYALIVVAGMEYGAAVESKGFDVLTGSGQLADENVKSAFNRLKTQLAKLT